MFLTLFSRPSMTEIVYHGTYTQLDGRHMSEAYASTLHISFDVRGGLLIWQLHHWAANVFVAAVAWAQSPIRWRLSVPVRFLMLLVVMPVDTLVGVDSDDRPG